MAASKPFSQRRRSGSPSCCFARYSRLHGFCGKHATASRPHSDWRRCKWRFLLANHRDKLDHSYRATSSSASKLHETEDMGRAWNSSRKSCCLESRDRWPWSSQANSMTHASDRFFSNACRSRCSASTRSHSMVASLTNVTPSGQSRIFFNFSF